MRDTMTDKISYDNVRRAAKRAGLVARKKSRRGYMLLDRRTRACIVGSWHELSAEAALAWIDRLRSQHVSKRPARRGRQWRKAKV
jgi:hypothetical protein